MSHSPIFLNGAQTGLHVCNLIDGSSRHRDRCKIFATFTPMTRDEILSMSLSILKSPNTMLWKENKAQKFSVRTAYQVVLCLHDQSRVETHLLSFIVQRGTRSGPSMCRQRFVHSFGEHARTAYQPMTTYTGSGSRWTPNVSYAANILRLQATFCGPVLSQETFGAWLRVEFRRVTTKWRIFSYSSSRQAE